MNGIDPALIPLLIPLVALQLGLLAWAMLDLLRPERRVKGGSKAVWALVIALVSLVGPLVYFLAGRDESMAEPPPPPPPGPGARAGWRAPTETTPAPGATATGAPGATATDVLGPAAGVAAPPVPARSTRRAAGDAPSAIAVDGLTKRYGGTGGVLALDALRLDVPAGSVFGLLGPNGAGKTTALRLLVGLTRPTAGTATVDGLRAPGDALAIRRRLGYLEQDPRGYGWMTGREQVELVGRLHGLRDAALADAASTALRRVGLADAAGRRVATYSGGMRQRLGIAGALVHRPAVVILDEPVSALDPEGRRDVLELIHDLRGESTVLFSTHVLADVERICDRVGILARGRLVVEGPLAELLDRYALPVYRVEAEPGQAAALEALGARLRDLDWVTSTAVEHGVLTIAVADPDRAARELLRVVAQADLAVVSLARARPTLEDVFLRLTGAAEEAA